MKTKIIHSFLHKSFLMIMSITIEANDSLHLITKETTSNQENFIQTVDGYLRAGYQQNDNRHTNIALGGKLHIETKRWNSISAGASFYTTNALLKHKGVSIAFFDADDHSYSILGEAYLETIWGNNTLKIGRQTIDTPFADTDDIGMVPNTFEGIVLTNHTIQDTTLFFAQLQKYAGVDSSTPSHFTQLNKKSGMQVIGVTYEGLKNTTFSGWFYTMKNSVDIGYADISYKNKINYFNYTLMAQYTQQKYHDSSKSTIYGLAAALDLDTTGLSASIAYNNVKGRAAENFFGGGPFVTNAEHHTLKDALHDGDCILYGLEWDTSHIGVTGLILSAHIDRHSNGIHHDTREYDISASYDYSKTLNITAIYSDIDDVTEPFTNLRLFVNYSF